MKVEFRSTLKREVERSECKVKQAKAAGYKEPADLLELFNLIKNSVAFLKARTRTIMVARNIQPSITDEDLKIASDMQLAASLELLLNLIRKGLIRINK